jgi:hypothetical protein
MYTARLQAALVKTGEVPMMSGLSVTRTLTLAAPIGPALSPRIYLTEAS